jgi:hypothetical protein
MPEVSSDPDFRPPPRDRAGGHAVHPKAASRSASMPNNAERIATRGSYASESSHHRGQRMERQREIVPHAELEEGRRVPETCPRRRHLDEMTLKASTANTGKTRRRADTEAHRRRWVSGNQTKPKRYAHVEISVEIR